MLIISQKNLNIVKMYKPLTYITYLSLSLVICHESNIKANNTRLWVHLNANLLYCRVSQSEET